MSIVQSVPWCESVDAKLDRAKEHLATINGELEAFNRRKPTFVPKTNPQTNEAYIVWWIDSPNPPLTISVRIGEFLYNLRSALDNLVCALVRKEKGNGASCSGNAFPIHTDCDVYERESARALKGVPPSARTLIHGLQPYSRGNTADKDPLNILNQLRNRDTHRALRVGLGYHKNTQVLVYDSFTRKLLAHSSLTDVVYPASGAPSIPLPITADQMPAMVDVKFGSSSGVMFREEGPWGDRTVNDVLATCYEYVEQRIMTRFTPFFL